MYHFEDLFKSFQIVQNNSNKVFIKEFTKFICIKRAQWFGTKRMGSHNKRYFTVPYDI
jgi:hypothetical protein